MRQKLHATSILLLVVLVSVAIMTVPTFFTKAISRVSLNKEIELPLVLNDKKDVKLIFFGYSGCTDICTPRLESIAEFFKTLDDDTKKRFGVEFIDISIPYDKELPNRFAHFFNDNFKGIYLNKEILRDYTKEFNVFFSPSLSDESEYDHTTNIYLIKRSENKKEIRYIYNSYPYDFKQIRLDIEELINE